MLCLPVCVPVNRGRGLVHDENAGLAEQGAGKADDLLLALREVRAIFLHLLQHTSRSVSMLTSVRKMQVATYFMVPARGLTGPPSLRLSA